MTEPAPTQASTFAAEDARRLRWITVARTVALVGIIGVVAAVNPPASWSYYFSLISCFAITGWANYAVSRSRWEGAWRAYAFAALDFALLTFTLIVPAPGAREGLPDVFFLRFDSFDYFYVILASLAISLRPSLLVWGGLCGVAFWSVGLVWLARGEAVTLEEPGGPDDAAIRALANAANPHHLDLGVQFQGLAIFFITSILLAVAVAASLRLAMREAAQERRAANLSRYLPAEMIESLADRDAPFGAERETEAAILFADIVGFSRIAEQRAPHEVVALLREVQALIEAQVFAQGGVLDKFIGDGAMASFGAVRRDGEDGREAAVRAVECARGILAAAAERNRRGGEPARISVGLHFGPVVVGDVGSARRMELAVIGDAVNVAARLETMTRELGVGAAVSDQAVAAAGRPAGLRLIGPRPIQGREKPVTVWAIDQP